MNRLIEDRLYTPSLGRAPWGEKHFNRGGVPVQAFDLHVMFVSGADLRRLCAAGVSDALS